LITMPAKLGNFTSALLGKIRSALTLASVFRAAVDYAKLARLMRLPEQQFVTFAQTVGYPRG